MLIVIVVFFKTRPPVEPVSFIHKICQDTADGVEHQRCRFVKRLTPLSVIGKVAGNGLRDVATEVIAPHFHRAEQSGKKVSSYHLTYCKIHNPENSILIRAVRHTSQHSK